MTWIPLHLHSQYSILDSSASVKALAKRAKAFGMPALALTDFGNMYGAVDFFKACSAEKIKPIIGLEIGMAPQSRHDKKKIYGVANSYPLILLAKDRVGYQNLCKITSIAFLEGFYYVPRIDREILEQHSEGLICLSGPLHGKIAKSILEGKEDELMDEIAWLKERFGDDFFFEIQRHEMSAAEISSDGMERESWLFRNYQDYIANQKKVNERLIELSKGLNIPLVGTHGSHYLDRDDWQAHEILMNVQSGEPCEIWEKDAHGRNLRRVPNPKRQVAPTHNLHFVSQQEMAERFADLPEALSNTLVIAERCCFEMDFSARYYPVFVPPHLEGKEYSEEERQRSCEAFLRQLCAEGIPSRYTPERLAKVQEKYPDEDPLAIVEKRLAYELDLIISKGMCDYLLIVYDFIAWAKRQNIPMGPGRGSGAGSIILYLIGITDIEPLRFSLFFERFINPERISYPDIDVDICMDRRSEVIEYTIKKYGKDKVAQIITFGTMKAKMAIKDVGRVLSVPLSKVNDIAKLVPEDPTMTLDKALEIDPDLVRFYESDEEAKRVIDLGRKLEGSIRNTGIHAAGLIIAGDPLTDHIPVCTSKDSDMVVTQYSMKPVESVGMLKIDFLGLKTLTSIQKTVIAIQRRRGFEIDWVNLPLDDMATFNLLNQGKTQGVFQLESAGMQDLAKQLHIDKFEEIIAVGALYRPGPMEMIPTFINRKHKREPIEYDHPWMADVLQETYGIMVYQEQVMQIAQMLAGYSLGEGDVLRRAMGKKDHEEMMRQREKFRVGALSKGIDDKLSMAIFDKVEKFASYGFNKSHAAAYGFLSYVTAFLKGNYPSEWLAALMTCDMDDITKVAKHIRECETMDIAILSPDVNESDIEFVATDAGIRFAMSGIKGVGRGVVEAIIEEREREGPFKSLYDFLKRVDTKRVGKKAVLHLIDAGGFDFCGWTRSQLRSSLDTIYESAVREQKEKEKGILDFFAIIEEETTSPFLTPPDNIVPCSKQAILSREKELLGFYLTGHPMDEYRGLLGRLSCVSFKELAAADHGSVFRIAFIIDSVNVRISQKSQKKFAILTISEVGDHFELPIWADLYESKAALLIENQLIYAVVQVDKREGDLRLSCRWLDDLTAISEEMVKACDAAYEHAKSMQLRDERRPVSDKPKEKKEEMIKQSVALHLNIEVMRLSHVLALKEILQNHPGSQPLTLHFSEGEHPIGHLKIEADWGITWDSEVEEKVKALNFLKKIVCG